MKPRWSCGGEGVLHPHRRGNAAQDVRPSRLRGPAHRIFIRFHGTSERREERHEYMPLEGGKLFSTELQLAAKRIECYKILRDKFIIAHPGPLSKVHEEIPGRNFRGFLYDNLRPLGSQNIHRFHAVIAEQRHRRRADPLPGHGDGHRRGAAHRGRAADPPQALFRRDGLLRGKQGLPDGQGPLPLCRGQEDRRVVYISLSEKGRKAYAHHENFHRQMIHEILEHLTQEETEVLLKSLGKLTSWFQGFQDRAGIMQQADRV